MSTDPNKARSDVEKFKERIAQALTNCGDVTRMIIKKKMLKRKISLQEMQRFVDKWAPETP